MTQSGEAEEQSTLDKVVSALQRNGKKHHIVDHPEDTATVDEKRGLFDDHPEIYQQYGDIAIVQGSVLTYQDGEGNDTIFLYFSNGGERIRFRDLRRSLELPKRVDITFYEDISEIVGLTGGEISPLVPIPERIDNLHFDKGMLVEAKQNPDRLYDMALSANQSLFANVADVYGAMLQLQIADRRLGWFQL